MNSKIILALTVLTSGAFVSTGAQAFPSSTAVCADGTVYQLTGDEITAEVACANHGGLSATQVPGAGGVATNTPHPPEPKRPGNTVARIVIKDATQRSR